MHVYVDTNMLIHADTKYVHACSSIMASEIFPIPSIQEQQQG